MKTTINDPILDIVGSSPRQAPFAQLRASLVALGLFTLLTGLAYPLLVTGIAQLAFPFQANGSLVKDPTGQVLGSRLLAQDFNKPEFFQARPSAVGYTAPSSGASNLAITNKKQDEAIAGRREAWAKQFGAAPAPADMLYASGSGLDPDISLVSALAQLSSVAAARKLDDTAKAELKALIETLATRVLPGEPARINVIDLNLVLTQDPAYKGKN